jgi:hypothetical protein
MSIEDIAFQYEEMPKDVEETLNKIYEEKGGVNYAK